MKKILICMFIFTGLLFAKGNTFGFAYINSTNIYINDESESSFFPGVNYSNDKFYIQGKEFGYKYSSNFSLLIEPRLKEVKFDGINTRKRTLEVGFKYIYPIDKYKLGFKTLVDMLGVHKGYKSSLTFSRTIVKMPFIFIPGVSLEYESKNLADYYYGVDSNESYSKYELNSIMNSSIGFATIFHLDRNLALNLVYKYKKLHKDVKNSPIINEDKKQTIILGLNYRF